MLKIAPNKLPYNVENEFLSFWSAIPLEWWLAGKSYYNNFSLVYFYDLWPFFSRRRFGRIFDTLFVYKVSALCELKEIEMTISTGLYFYTWNVLEQY